MKRIITIGFIFVLVLAFNALVFAGGDEKHELGKTVADFTLKDLDGKEHSLGDYLEGESNGVLVMFLSHNCPVSRACDERYVKLAKDFAEKGIHFVGINSNKTDPVDEIKAAAEKNGYTFPVLKDWDNVIADRFEAQTTPHAFLIDKNGTLIYKGRIDDNHRRPDSVKEQTLRNAVGEYLTGKELSVTETKSVGCTIKRVK